MVCKFCSLNLLCFALAHRKNIYCIFHSIYLLLVTICLIIYKKNIINILMIIVVHNKYFSLSKFLICAKLM